MTQEQVLKRMLGAIELAGGSTSRLNKDERKQLKRAASLKFGCVKRSSHENQWTLWQSCP
jgi:hypothetical protein